MAKTEDKPTTCPGCDTPIPQAFLDRHLSWAKAQGGGGERDQQAVERVWQRQCPTCQKKAMAKQP